MRLQTRFALAPHNHGPVFRWVSKRVLVMTTYFSCSICHRIAASSKAQFECPYCGSLMGQRTHEFPAVPKGVVRPGGRGGLRNVAPRGMISDEGVHHDHTT
jgi:predicted RNA-binding Zn-ribbon protein involved in translation (DUF1610 family)